MNWEAYQNELSFSDWKPEGWHINLQQHNTIWAEENLLESFRLSTELAITSLARVIGLMAHRCLLYGRAEFTAAFTAALRIKLNPLWLEVNQMCTRAKICFESLTKCIHILKEVITVLFSDRLTSMWPWGYFCYLRKKCDDAFKKFPWISLVVTELPCYLGEEF